MESNSADFVSPRAQRLRNRMLRQELAAYTSLDVTLSPREGASASLAPITPCSETADMGISPNTKPRRSKRRDTSRGPDVPSQPERAKKRRKDRKKTLPTKDTNSEVTTKEVMKMEEIEDWVRSFEQFSNSKQSLALSMLVPR